MGVQCDDMPVSPDGYSEADAMRGADLESWLASMIERLKFISIRFMKYL